MDSESECSGVPQWPSDEEIERLHQTVLCTARRVCPPWLRNELEDIVQDALMKLLDLRQRSPEGQEFNTAYMRKIVECRVIDEIRRRRDRKEVPIEADDPDGPALDVVDGRPGPDRNVLAREVGQALQDCLQRLHPPRRRAVTLKLLGYSAAEMSGLMGWKEKQVRNLVFRGLEDLRRCLAAKGIQR